MWNKIKVWKFCSKTELFHETMKENASQLFFVITKKSCLALKTVQNQKEERRGQQTWITHRTMNWVCLPPQYVT